MALTEAERQLILLKKQMKAPKVQSDGNMVAMRLEPDFSKLEELFNNLLSEIRSFRPTINIPEIKVPEVFVPEIKIPDFPEAKIVKVQTEKVVEVIKDTIKVEGLDNQIKKLLEGLSNLKSEAINAELIETVNKRKALRTMVEGAVNVNGDFGSYQTTTGEVRKGRVDNDGHVQVDVQTMPSITIPPVTIDPTGLATDANQTNGSQKTQIVDNLGNAVTVTGNKLDVNASVDTTGLALDNTLTDGSQTVKLVDGSNTPLQSTGSVLNVLADLGSVGADITSIESQQTDGSAKTQVVDALNTNIDFATSAKQDDIITAIGAIPGGGGVQYTEGDVDASITGTAIMFEDTGDTLVAVSATKPLPVSASIDTTGLATEVTLQAVDTKLGGTLDVDTGLTQPLTDTELRATPVHVETEAIQDTGNSTTTPLGSNATFTGTGFDMNMYASWSVNIFANQASATNGLKVQWSDDNTNWDFVDQATYDASVGNMVTFGRKARYVRLVYTNGTAAQATFRVTAYAQPISVRQTRKFVGSAVKDQDTAQLVTAALQGHSTAGGGTWVDVKVNPSGALTAAVTAADGDVFVRSNSASTFPVNAVQSGTWNVTNVSGTVSLPTGASTSAKQDTGNTSLGNIDTKTPALGQALMAASSPVTIASNQSALAVTATNATAANLKAEVIGTGTFAVQSTNQANSGVDIGDVTINNSTGAAAVNIQDGGNTITVDGTVSANATLSAETTKVIGTVNQGTSPWVTSNAVLSVVGGGTEATAQRVTIANDSTGVLSVDDNGSSLTVDYATTGSGTATGALRVELPTNGTGTVGLNAGTNAIGKLAANSGVDIGDVDILSIAAGTNAIGNVGIIPRTTGGLTTYHLVSAATTNAAVVKASAGQLFGWYIYNSNASARKVAFHNASSTPTAGASIYFTIVIPPTSGANVFSDVGIAFSTGIAITTVTDLTDAGTTAVAANDLIINLWYA